MAQFPVDVPIGKIIKIFELLEQPCEERQSCCHGARERRWDSNNNDHAESPDDKRFDIAYHTDTDGDIEGRLPGDVPEEIKTVL